MRTPVVKDAVASDFAQRLIKMKARHGREEKAFIRHYLMMGVKKLPKSAQTVFIDMYGPQGLANKSGCSVEEAADMCLSERSRETWERAIQQVEHTLKKENK